MYLGVIVFLGVALTGYWVYHKYFSAPVSEVITFKAERGPIQEIVNVRGEVVPVKEFSLEFPYSGIIDRIFVAKGDKITRGEALMKLETKDIDFELSRLDAVLTQSQANLNKLKAGATLEDEGVSQANVERAQAEYESAKTVLVTALTDAFTRADDTVRNKIDPLFNNPNTSPQLSFSPSDPQTKIDIEALRLALESRLKTWNAAISSLTTSSDLTAATTMADTGLTLARALSDKATQILNTLQPNAAVAQTTIDTWRTNVSAGRLSVGVAITNLASAKEKIAAARAALTIAENELTLKRAGTRAEEIAIAIAQIDEVKSEIGAAEDRRAKATLYAPANGTISDIGYERREVFVPGKPAITLSMAELKMQSDVSELDIGKVRPNDGGRVTIKFDAFPGAAYEGQVISIDPKEIIKEGDTFYRVNIFFDPSVAAAEGNIVRSGMRADLVIAGIAKNDVIKIPSVAIYKKDERTYVLRVVNGVAKETEVKSGISDNEDTEITEGLNAGDIVQVPANQ